MTSIFTQKCCWTFVNKWNLFTIEITLCSHVHGKSDTIRKNRAQVFPLLFHFLHLKYQRSPYSYNKHEGYSFVAFIIIYVEQTANTYSQVAFHVSTDGIAVTRIASLRKDITVIDVSKCW